jgi:electron transfer flavoprotein beta subunit
VKILVPVKRVPDPTQKAKIKDGHIDLTGASWIVNTFDEYAVETALRLLENGESNTRSGGEIIVVSIGPDEASKEIRTCLAMGADRAIHVVAKDEEIDSLTVVKVLQGVIDAEKPDLVIMGKQAVDGDANQVGQMLAGKLGWPQATFAASIEVSGDSFVVGREVDGGVEYKRVPKHSVITVDLRIVGPKSVKNGVTPDSFAYSGEGARLPERCAGRGCTAGPPASRVRAGHAGGWRSHR